jgi:hypothetical protein
MKSSMFNLPRLLSGAKLPIPARDGAKKMKTPPAVAGG